MRKFRKISLKKALKYFLISLIVCNGSAIIMRCINIFLGINTPGLWYYIVPANMVSIAMMILMLVANKDKIFKKPIKKKVPRKNKTHRKRKSTDNKPKREFERKVS